MRMVAFGVTEQEWADLEAAARAKHFKDVSSLGKYGIFVWMGMNKPGAHRRVFSRPGAKDAGVPKRPASGANPRGHQSPGGDA